MGGGHGQYQTDTSIRDLSPEIQGHLMFIEAQGSVHKAIQLFCSIDYQTKKGIILHGLKARETDGISFQLDSDDRQLLGQAIAPEHLSQIACKFCDILRPLMACLITSGGMGVIVLDTRDEFKESGQERRSRTVKLAKAIASGQWKKAGCLVPDCLYPALRVQCEKNKWPLLFARGEGEYSGRCSAAFHAPKCAGLPCELPQYVG